jgi:hypothetical protein
MAGYDLEVQWQCSNTLYNNIHSSDVTTEYTGYGVAQSRASFRSFHVRIHRPSLGMGGSLQSVMVH